MAGTYLVTGPYGNEGAGAYYDPVRGLLRKIGVIKRERKQPFDSVANEQTTVHHREERPGK